MLPRFCMRFKIKYLISLIIFIIILDFFGAFTHIFEIDFYKDFHYPIDGDVIKYAKQIRHGKKPDIDPINIYNYSFIYNCHNKCIIDENLISPRLVFIIKSAIKNFDKRNTIRLSWGYEKRFSDVDIRTVFILGKSDDNDARQPQKLIDIEANTYNDIVQGDFIDAYFNNTIKTMMGFKWAVNFCPRSKFYMFIDDDFYVSAKNVLRFIRNPVYYPEYLEEADETLRKLARKLNQSDFKGNQTNGVDLNVVRNIVANSKSHSVEHKKHLNHLKKFIFEHDRNLSLSELTDINNNAANKKQERHLLDTELPGDVKLFAGFVFSSSPHRHKTSKWHVTLEEYPWHMWPPYVTAGAFILSREALLQMYYVSMFTKHFRFDDIYLGLVALKTLIEPLHSEEFYFHRAPYYGPHSYKYVIASHGYDDPQEMAKLWNELRAAGHA